MDRPDRDIGIIGSDRLSLAVKADGAEMTSLRDAAGREFLWQAGPEWPRHAPVLFPVVGRLANDRLLHRGIAYPMAQHGFARDRRFTWVERRPDSCRLVLEDDAETRTRFPFPFRLEIAYRVGGDRVDVDYAITNSGKEVLPVSLGAHPGFRWPLVDGMEKEAHHLRFEWPEPGPLRGVVDGLIAAESHPSPIQGDRLDLHDALFSRNALILDPVRSRWVRYGIPDGPTIEVGWSDMPQLGIWSKPGADFLCIEPWHGLASPVDFQGEFMDKPGLMHIDPGGERTLSLYIRIF